MTPFQQLEQDLKRLPETSNERSLYAPLVSFLRTYANGLYKTDTFHAVAEESGSYDDTHIGFPDITLRNGAKVVGWIEVKLLKDPLSKPQFNEQFTRYKNSLQNLVITNLDEWQLWQWNEDNKPILVSEIGWQASSQSLGGDDIQDFLKRFLEGIAFEVRTPKQLAIALARKTQLLSHQVQQSYQQSNEDAPLYRLKETFEQTLIQNITVHQFANMVAETMAYSLFLARLEYEEKHPNQDFSIDIAEKFLPRSVPILRDLYDLVLRVSQDIGPIGHGVQLLIDQLNLADIERIRHKLTDHKPGEDPVIQFYEPFLSAYDPIERGSRGVYYTPKPLVDYIVRGVDHILKTRFEKKSGLADQTVEILDPATGSGTFLMSAIQQANYNLKQEYGGLGESELRSRFHQLVLDHILKHFYGFELLMAPYAVAHLKLTLELERMGFDWSMTENDRDSDNDRLKVYLANSLDDPDQPPKFDLPGFHLAEESNKALEVKRKASVLAILGNPPYSGESMNPHQYKVVEKGITRTHDTFIGTLIKDYKKEPGGGQLQERTSKWLQDDYVKFIRLAEYLINNHGEGVIGFVTNHGYLTNPTFRGMRWHLLKTFDEIYILDLHGNSMKKEVAPDGGKDENIFAIQQGVSVIFAIKHNIERGDGSDNAVVWHADLWGRRRDKEAWLLENSFENTNFVNIAPKQNTYLFVPIDTELEQEYNSGFSLTSLFNTFGAGITTAHDNLVISNSESKLKANADVFATFEGSNSELCAKLDIRDKPGWDITKARKALKTEPDIDEYIIPISYRPFESQKILYHDNLVWRPVRKLMTNYLEGENIGLMVCRQQKTDGFNHVMVHNHIVESSFVSNRTSEIGYSFPLYVYPDKQQLTIDGSTARKANFDENVVKSILAPAGLKWVSDHKQKNTNDPDTASPLDLLDYIYATLHSPTYRMKYKHFLKSDFPRVPNPKDAKTFWDLASLGSQLRVLHLLGEGTLGPTQSILTNSSQWHIHPQGHRDGELDWKIENIEYNAQNKTLSINDRQYFDGIEPNVWDFYIGSYQVLEKWLKDYKKTNQLLGSDDRLKFIKIVAVVRETISLMNKIDQIMDTSK